MKLTRRGQLVLVAFAMLSAATLGFATAEWCWYGQCDHLVGKR